MKKLYFIVVAVMLFPSCDLIESVINPNDSSSIKGTTDIPINTIGNTFTNGVRVGSSYYQGNIKITAINDGVATVSFKSTIPPNYPILQGIKSKYKDSSGNLTCEGKFKMTDKGILDYNNIDHEPFVLVKYDAEVGDKYTLKKSDGKTIVREVVRKSTTDDFYWGGMFIKTIDVEQSSNIPGVESITYFCNHKFGVVAVRLQMEDGSTPQMDLVPTNY
jgi:hypothetical protein